MSATRNTYVVLVLWCQTLKQMHDINVHSSGGGVGIDTDKEGYKITNTSGSVFCCCQIWYIIF